MSWNAVTAHRAQLGEGPFWDVPTQALHWVDIACKQALRLRAGRLQIWQLPEHVSAFIPCESGDALVTLSSGVYRLDLATEDLTLLCVADRQRSPLRCPRSPVAGHHAEQHRRAG
jgi:sugar lactone lactonase YvrE